MLLGIPYQRRQVLMVIGDVVMALVAWQAGHALRLGLDQGAASLGRILAEESGATTFFVVTHLVLLYVADAFDPGRDYRRGREILRLLLAVGAAFLAQATLFYLFPHWWVGRGVAALSSLCFAALLPAWRVALTALRPLPTRRHRCLVVGAGRSGHAIAEVVRTHQEHGSVYDLIGFVDDVVQHSTTGLLVLGPAVDLVKLTRKHRIDLVIVAIRGGMHERLTQQLLECKSRGLTIVDMPSLYKRLTGKVPIDHVADTWLIFGPGFHADRPLIAASQRLADLALALVGLTLSAPVILIAGIIIRLETPGPAFFLQERLGKGERPFTIIKLRTMGRDAEAKTGAVWSQGAGDPRVTRVGRFLRRTRIDELPQFWNVLRGDMSMVGPRPEREHFVRQLEEQIPFYALRFAVKPGVTGWAQVMYRYGATTEDAAEKLRYELFSIQEMSPLLYVLIVLKTLQTVLVRPGS